MINYSITAIKSETKTALYYGSLAGFTLGFYVTLAKTPYFILIDCLYGAFLGFIFTFAFCLLIQCVSFESDDVQQACRHLTERGLYLFLNIARKTSNKKLEQYCLSSLRQMGIEEGPISSRTRAKTSE